MTPNKLKERIEAALKSAIKNADLPVVRNDSGEDQNKEVRDRAVAELCGAAALFEDPETGLYITIWDISKYGVEPLHEDVSMMSFGELKAIPLEWDWPGRIARGKVTLFSGDPGCGKSMATIDIAARITQGAPWPDGSGNAPLGEVILISDEDDPEDTILPRLIAAGADPKKVHFPKMRTAGVERSLNLAEDVGLLRRQLQALRSPHTTVIFDPINNYVGKLDDRSDIRVRDVMMPLVRLARELRISIICVKHLNKDSSKPASYRTSGAGWVGIARQMWMFAPDPENEGLYVMVNGKINLGPGVKGLSYRIEQREGDLAAHIEWLGPTDVKADQALAQKERKGRGRPSEGKLDAARDFLQQLLRENGEVMPSKQIFEQAGKLGMNESIIYKAKEALGIRAERNGRAQEWYWVLPVDDRDEDSAMTTFESPSLTS